MADLAKIKTGPWKIVVGSTTVGHTERGSLNFSAETQLRRREVDRYGASPADEVYEGEIVTATFRVAEEVQENLALALPFAYDGASYLLLGKRPGDVLSAHAQEVTLHPLTVLDSDTTWDIVMHKAGQVAAVAIPLGTAGDRIFEVTFEALIDESKSNENLLAKWNIPAR